MNDDLTRPLDFPGGDNPGQSEGASVQGRQGPTEQDFNTLKSIKDKEVGEATRRAEEAERKAREAQAKAEQIAAQNQAMLNDVRASNPEAADLLIQRAALAESEAELAQARRIIAERDEREAEQRAAQEQKEAAEQWWNDTAQKMGINPYDAEFQDAVRQSVATGDQSYAQRALINLSGQEPKRTPLQETSDDAAYIPPPSGGGGRISDEDRLMKEYLEKRKTFQGDSDRLWELKRQYRSKGLTIE